MGILSGVIGNSSAGIAEYSRAIHGLGADDVPSFLSVGSALGLKVVLTALFLYVIFNATSAVAKPEMAGLTIGGYLFVAHLIGVPLGDSSLTLLAASDQPFFRGTALANVWVFILAPIIGGLIGMLCTELLRSRTLSDNLESRVTGL